FSCEPGPADNQAWAGLLQPGRRFSFGHDSIQCLFNLRSGAKRRRLHRHLQLPASFGSTATECDTERYAECPTPFLRKGNKAEIGKPRMLSESRQIEGLNGMCLGDMRCSRG